MNRLRCLLRGHQWRVRDDLLALPGMPPHPLLRELAVALNLRDCSRCGKVAP